MAPGEKPVSVEWFDGPVNGGVELDEGAVEDDGVIVKVVDAAVVVELEDSVPPSTSAITITSAALFGTQHSVLSPQHHLSLSALPSHGVTRTFPVGYLELHTLRQFLLATFLSVQKSIQYL